ncbi:Ada metal-binding domain-containing protein [Compostimonas suwonensis]|uniref:DNA-3-methyladenine glycosylase II n=1 Tax=Compostimonas suwonensis TaxID=1048394 RepID=A0A2M9BU01_9MICO|nr:Ada metal-binding domain-containing protein [Compostimonas suwonensis]PJJ61400.1 AraC family transcriptional regulator of adaptative response / DNA-3-methyladenine glycosylase II [Compostimonas suwonensis]
MASAVTILPTDSDPVFAERYRAMSSRDARFDGQFITGVHSTGIYCRPSCPATTPKPQNVTFYLTAAAAHEAGLRACKRCLPDAVPGSPEWNVRDDLAARAMRLITDGVVEREGVPGLAGRLGYTPRHLGRILVSELGAGPLALSRAHRAQTARILLTATDLPVADVAFAAGFASVRQFNDTIREVYERTPTALRATAKTPGSSAEEHGDGTVALSLRLPARAPFDGAGLFRFFAARAVDGTERIGGTERIDGTERIGENGYSRIVRLPGGPAVISLSLGGTSSAPLVLCDATLGSIADVAPFVARVRRLLDLDADAVAIDGVLARDEALAASVAAVPGIRVPGSLDPHETLFRALIGQQVSVASARTALTRLTLALGDVVERGGSTWRLFPTPAQIAEGGTEVLRGPARRTQTIVAVAAALANGELEVGVGDSREHLTERLLAVPGIGPWTAGYIALRVLGAPDILLTSDLALRQGAERLGLPSAPRELEGRGLDWAPWRSYAGMHLWRAAAPSAPSAQ